MIEVALEDEEYGPARSAQELQKLIDVDNILAFFPCPCSAGIEVIVPDGRD